MWQFPDRSQRSLENKHCLTCPLADLLVTLGLEGKEKGVAANQGHGVHPRVVQGCTWGLRSSLRATCWLCALAQLPQSEEGCFLVGLPRAGSLR